MHLFCLTASCNTHCLKICFFFNCTCKVSESFSVLGSVVTVVVVVVVVGNNTIPLATALAGTLYDFKLL